MASRQSAKARRAAFVDAYFAHNLNGRAAAKALGIHDRKADYFVKTLMADERVQQMIAERQAALQRKFSMTADDVLLGLQRLALSDRRKFFNSDNSPKDITELGDDEQLALDGWDVEERSYPGEKRGERENVRVSKVRLVKRLPAFDMLMKHFGLYAKDNAQRAGDPDEVAAKIRAKLGEIDDSTTGGGK